MQLDIFEDNRDVMLRNDVVHALLARDLSLARASLDLFAAEFPQDETLQPLSVLVAELEGVSAEPFREAALVQQASQALQENVEPAAQRVLGVGAGPWLASFWRNLAERASELAYRSDHADDYAAALWLRAGDTQAAIQAVERVASWRRIPAPLAWMVQARLREYGLQATWGLVAELAWLAPARLRDVVRLAAEPQLELLIGRFEASFDGLGDVNDLVWFPAWVLIERPAAVRHLALAEAGLRTEPENVMRLLVELLGLERQGRHHDLVARRKALRDTHPALYADYMKTR